MDHALLNRGSPRELANLRQVIETKEYLGSFTRLARIVETDLASLEAGKMPQQWRQLPVAIRLSFGWADAGQQFPALRGDICASVAAVCQRCLEAFELPLELHLKLRFMPPGAAGAPQAGYEDWELAGDTLLPADIVEEALIMALPLSATHDTGDSCGTLREAEVTEDMAALHPFAGLRAKMKERH
ncbi:MAG: hypothetical protein BMS9Abin32_302 [Gammaproteobacteria bacterium]|nr:MAG: hypothetical protein BMS9Abin32_302 [Gammaproteobacteria bacterium]